VTEGPITALDPALARGSFVVLDVRDEAAFTAGHLAGSGHVPLSELKARRAELPPRESPVLIVGDDAGHAARAAERLRTMEFRTVAWLAATLAQVPGGEVDRGPAARLWRPASFLEEVLPHLPRGRAADLAAGSGREAVFLAMNGFTVEAWEAAPEALERARALAARHEVRITAVPCDLEAVTPPLPAAAYRLIVCFRFLHRPLLPAIARALEPGGHLVYETYRVGQERLGRPRRRQFLLEPGELRLAFADLEVLSYEEPDPPEGPITARLLARRPDR